MFQARPYYFEPELMFPFREIIAGRAIRAILSHVLHSDILDVMSATCCMTIQEGIGPIALY